MSRARVLSGVACADGLPCAEGLALAGADSTCTPGSAQLAIGDGFQENLCGCQETGGAVVATGTGPVTCTVNSGTQIFFYYLGTRLRHQVISATGDGFAASPVSDPADKTMTKVHSFQITVPGTYGYVDAFDAGITGQFVVQ